MLKEQLTKYQSLNKIAESNGMVILGGTEDIDIPLCELKQAFELNSKLYNRSVAGLSINDALEIYHSCVEPLHPECILLHIGEADLKFFKEMPSDFDRKYRELVEHIKATNVKCNIVIISLKNYDEDKNISELNKHLKYIAESERCEFSDISSKRVWNPRQTKDVVSFVYATGFVHPLTRKKPIYDLVKILFCYEAACIV